MVIVCVAAIVVIVAALVVAELLYGPFRSLATRVLGAASVIAVLVGTVVVMIALQAEKGSAPDAGRVLDPDDVDWLDPAPDRTDVEAEALRVAFDRLSEQLVGVFPGDPARLPHAIIDRRFVPGGYGEANDVTVLVGVSQTETMTPPVDRCAFLRDVAGRLAAEGWWIRATSSDSVQTSYPIVSPGPQDHSLHGESVFGTFSLEAPVEGLYWLTYAVDARNLRATEPIPQPANPPAINCE